RASFVVQVVKGGLPCGFAGWALVSRTGQLHWRGGHGEANQGGNRRFRGGGARSSCLTAESVGKAASFAIGIAAKAGSFGYDGRRRQSCQLCHRHCRQSWQLWLRRTTL